MTSFSLCTNHGAVYSELDFASLFIRTEASRLVARQLQCSSASLEVPLQQDYCRRSFQTPLIRENDPIYE